MSVDLKEYAIGGAQNDLHQNQFRTDIKENKVPLRSGTTFKCEIFYLENTRDLERYNELITGLYSQPKKFQIVCDEHNFTKEGSVVNIVKYLNLKGNEDKKEEGGPQKEVITMGHLDMMKQAISEEPKQLFENNPKEEEKKEKKREKNGQNK